MSNFAVTHEHEAHISVYFDVEVDEVMAIGEKMEAINEQAYMNGYNWEAFLNHYLKVNQPKLLIGMDTDSEAGTYVALYPLADESKANKLADIINGLIDNPSVVYDFLEQHGEAIEWD